MEDKCSVCSKIYDHIGEFDSCCSEECMKCYFHHDSHESIPTSKNYENEYVLKIDCEGKYMITWCCTPFYSDKFDPKRTIYYPIHKLMFENLIDGLDVTHLVDKNIGYEYIENIESCNNWFIYPIKATIVKKK